MILPTKHIKLSNSLLSVGAALLPYIGDSRSVTSLWNIAKTLEDVKTYERFTLGLDFLFLMGLIDFEDGLLTRVAQ